MLTEARIVHGVVGLLFVAVLYALSKRRPAGMEWIVVPLATWLGTWVPDWDLSFGGIGNHRNPIFHSIVPALLVLALFYAQRHRRWATAAITGMAAGVGSHLFWDTPGGGDVRDIENDNLYLLVNGALCLVLAFYMLRRYGTPRQPRPGA